MGISLEGIAPLLQVFDMPRSVAFYRDVLGFEIAASSPSRGQDDFDWALLRLDGVELMLNTTYESDRRPPEPDPRRVAAHGDTALFFGCPDLDATYSYLRGKGVGLEPPVLTSYGMRQLHLTDPDGYAVCFQRPA